MNDIPEDIREGPGGCGRYQVLITITIHTMLMIYCWSYMGLIIQSSTPPWWCDSELLNETFADNTVDFLGGVSKDGVFENLTDYSNIYSNETFVDQLYESCFTPSGNKCTAFIFKGRSVVSEFELVCDDAFATSLIMTIQNAGALFGNQIAGHLSDSFGRKGPLFGSLALMTISLFIGLVAKDWIVYAITRLFVGVAASALYTIAFSHLSELTMSRYRAWAIGFPSWALESTLLAGVAYALDNWKYVQLTAAILGLACMFTWWFIPESVRWYISRGKETEARKVLRRQVMVNKRRFLPSTKQLEPVGDTEIDQNGQATNVEFEQRGRFIRSKTEMNDRKYTIIDLFRSKYILKTTILLTVSWCVIGIVSSSIAFGIPQLSGNVYLNLFILSIGEIPIEFLAIYLGNRIGRKRTSILYFLLTSIGALAAGIINQTGYQQKDSITRGLALFANIAIYAAWVPMQTITLELYPTVIRSIGFGTMMLVSNVGEVVGPQIVYLSADIPGLLYLISGGLTGIGMIAMLGLDETKGKSLEDQIREA